MTTQGTTKTYDKPKRTKFADNLITSIVTGKGTNADNYLDAGFKAKTRKIAKTNASRLKRHPEVIQRVKTFKEKVIATLTDELVIERLEKIIKATDNRSALGGIQERNKILDIYPAGKLKISQYEDELKSLE